MTFKIHILYFNTPLLLPKTCIGIVFYFSWDNFPGEIANNDYASLRSWRDIARECFFSRRTGSREHEWRSRERIGEESS